VRGWGRRGARGKS